LRDEADIDNGGAAERTLRCALRFAAAARARSGRSNLRARMTASDQLSAELIKTRRAEWRSYHAATAPAFHAFA
jgi:hypothetical protein